jgi:RNA polymerase sigma factor (sigma-70 family)
MQNENTLIQKIQNKDENALSLLYDNYSGALYGIIIRMCKDEQHAQNLLQDTFLTIWEKAHQYNPEKGKFYTWAYRIAKNKTLNFLRQSSNLIQTEDLSVHSNKEDTPTNEPNYLGLSGCLKQLETHHQKAIELVYFQGLTHREAHKEMDVPLGTFKSYIKQALKKLQLSYDRVVIWLLILIEVTT